MNVIGFFYEYYHLFTLLVHVFLKIHPFVNHKTITTGQFMIVKSSKLVVKDPLASLDDASGSLVSYDKLLNSQTFPSR